MNALQRALILGPKQASPPLTIHGNGSVRHKPEECNQGNFFSVCADGLMENNIRLWNSQAFTAEITWTIHSLSGEGAPFSFTVGNNTFGEGDSGTKFGDGQSIGFRLAKNFSETFGVSFGGDRLWHLDQTTDLSKPLYLRGTKIFRLNNSHEPPIISLTLGLMSDIYNPDTNIGTIKYPDWLREVISFSICGKVDGNNKRGGDITRMWQALHPLCLRRETIFAKAPTRKNKDASKKSRLRRSAQLALRHGHGLVFMPTSPETSTLAFHSSRSNKLTGTSLPI